MFSCTMPNATVTKHRTTNLLARLCRNARTVMKCTMVIASAPATATIALTDSAFARLTQQTAMATKRRKSLFHPPGSVVASSSVTPATMAKLFLWVKKPRHRPACSPPIIA